MSPLLSMRAPVSVNVRLLGACGVTGLVAIAVAVGAGTDRPTAAVPSCLAVGCVCAALMAHLLFASAQTVSDTRLLWISAGVTVAFAGLVASVLSQPTISPRGGALSQGEDAMAARYVIWHLALLIAGLVAVARVRARPRELVAFAAGGVPLVLWASLSEAPLGDLAAADGSYHATVRAIVGLIALAQLGVAFAWWQRAAGGPTWGEMCVVVLMGLSGLDALAYLFASHPYEGAWWASLTLRAGQFAVPAVGLLLGFIAVAERLRDLQEELLAGLEAERERARREEELAGLDRTERVVERNRILRLVDGYVLGVAPQPIMVLDIPDVVGLDSVPRFYCRAGH